jgi:hypothetical protein
MRFLAIGMVRHGAVGPHRDTRSRAVSARDRAQRLLEQVSRRFEFPAPRRLHGERRARLDDQRGGGRDRLLAIIAKRGNLNLPVTTASFAAA